ncbi:MAG: Ppx/GppA phosphatase family protein [Pseudomonadota bacterium]
MDDGDKSGDRPGEPSPHPEPPTASGSGGGGKTSERRPARRSASARRFAALDLGTNNCRLLIATPRGGGFRVIDAFSRIVRLGEGLATAGALSQAAMDRTIDALKICAQKVERRNVYRGRYIATQACRAAANGGEFLERVTRETGLNFEIISTEEEARLAVRGCSDLIDPNASAAAIFDIGGGSTEISWVKRDGETIDIAAWLSLPLGVVNLSEAYGGRELDASAYDDVVEAVRSDIRAFGDPAALRPIFDNAGAHLLGTSGTVTSIAGVHLDLPRYRRDLVDGLWLSDGEARAVSTRLRGLDFEGRAGLACIGRERADLVVYGCAILEALMREWPAARIRVADRGLREGVLSDLMEAARRRRRPRGRGRRRA